LAVTSLQDPNKLTNKMQLLLVVTWNVAVADAATANAPTLKPEAAIAIVRS
jgi:hypothetical protein